MERYVGWRRKRRYRFDCNNTSCTTCSATIDPAPSPPSPNAQLCATAVLDAGHIRGPEDDVDTVQAESVELLASARCGVRPNPSNSGDYCPKAERCKPCGGCGWQPTRTEATPESPSPIAAMAKPSELISLSLSLKGRYWEVSKARRATRPFAAVLFSLPARRTPPARRQEWRGCDASRGVAAIGPPSWLYAGDGKGRTRREPAATPPPQAYEDTLPW